jgi:hypothetical protein
MTNDDARKPKGAPKRSPKAGRGAFPFNERWRSWRDCCGAATALKERERDDRDDEIARLKSKVGEIAMDNELLCAEIAALEGKRPLYQKRPPR